MHKNAFLLDVRAAPAAVPMVSKRDSQLHKDRKHAFRIVGTHIVYLAGEAGELMASRKATVDGSAARWSTHT